MDDSISRARSGQGGTVSLLVVDDNPGDRDLIEAHLDAPAGACHVVPAASLAEAAAIIQDRAIDLVLLDLGLPDSQGLDTFKQMRQKAGGVPIVVVTGLDDDNLGAEAVRGGAQDYLAKNRMDRHTLVRSIRFSIERSEARARIDHLGGMLRAIRNVNQLIVREKNPEELAKRACEMLLDVRGYTGVWLLRQNGKVQEPASAGDAWNGSFKRFCAKIGEGWLPDCVKTAAESDTGVASFFPKMQCPECPLQESDAFAGSACAELRHGGRHYGYLGIAAEKDLSIDEEELDLLQEIAEDLAFAMQDIELNADHRRAEAEREAALQRTLEQARLMSESNRLLLDLASIPVEDDFGKIVASSLRGICNAVAVSFTEYDHEKRTLAVRGLDMEKGLFARAANILGRRLEEIESPVNDETYQMIVTNIVGRRDTLTEVTFGEVPPAVGKAVQKALGVERFIGLAYVIEGKLYGTSVLAMGKGRPDPPDEWLEALAHMIAVSLRRRAAEESLLEKSRDLKKRVDELRCLFGVSKAMEGPADSLGSVLEEAVELMPLGYRWPGRTCARIICDGSEARSKGFKTSDRKLSRDISTSGGTAGKIEVFLEGPLPQSANEAFLPEEQNLIDEVARQLGAFVERSHARSRLEESEKRFRAIIESSPDAIFITDENGKYTYVNPSATRLLGYSAGELTGMGILDISLPDKVGDNLDTFRRILEEGRGFFEIDLLRKDGSVVPVDLNAVVLPNGSIFGSCRDLTERRMAALRLEKSQAMLARAESVAHVGSWEWDVASDTVSWSDELFRIMGMEPSDRAPSFSEHQNLYHPDDMETLRRAVKEAVEKGAPYELELRAMANNAEEKICMARGQAEMGPDGRAARLFGSLQDITKQKQLEEQLNHSMKMEAIGRLAGGVAHDFNNALTPLLVICGFLLSEFPAGHRHHEDLKEMRESAERCVSLTRQLLAFARRQPLDISTINLNSVIANIDKMLSRIMGEDIEFVKDLDPELWSIRADAGQVEQIFANLCVNARDAMPGGGRLSIETRNAVFGEDYCREHPGVSPGEHVTLTVADNGTGMNKATLENVFEPFFTTKEQGKGTGLGLATVYGIVKQSGGEIMVRSEPGHGTSFTVVLPRAEEDIDETVIREDEPEENWEGSETVLLVEDEPSVRKVASRVLADLGYRIIEAGDGAEALDLCESRAGNIDLMVTDVVMPRMGGKELARKLSEKYPGMKVIFISGYTDDAIFHRGAIDRDTNFIQKPFSIDVLAYTVRKVLDAEK